MIGKGITLPLSAVGTVTRDFLGPFVGGAMIDGLWFCCDATGGTLILHDFDCGFASRPNQALEGRTNFGVGFKLNGIANLPSYLPLWLRVPRERRYLILEFEVVQPMATDMLVSMCAAVRPAFRDVRAAGGG